MAARRLPLHTRAQAWAYTGPLGHLWGGAADWATLLWRVARDRQRSGNRPPGDSPKDIAL